MCVGDRRGLVPTRRTEEAQETERETRRGLGEGEDGGAWGGQALPHSPLGSGRLT